jgi:hypothetical protein
MGHAVRGCRGYLAINGGITVDRVLGSASTFPAARFGGINGQPLAAGTIHFFPDESRGTKGPMSTGVLQSDGSYSLHGPGQNVGAMVGNHRVYLTLPLQDVMPIPVVVDGAVVLQAPPREPAVGASAQIPKKFLQPETSAWTATVSEGKANVLDFEITK